jgi:peptidoglycan hydrolase CwlO-like protein
VYLKDLTTKCELKAKEWDQRSQMRADELAALTQALSVLVSTVAEKANTTGEGGRSLLEQTVDDDDFEEEISFVQKAIRKVEATHTDDQDIREKLVSLLRTAGQKWKSPVLSALALKAGEDPFKKIKGMIQELIERLLAEEADEANHKGWCDTEISKTLKDRDYRLRDIEELHTSIESLNARKEKLTMTKTELEEALAVLKSDLKNQTEAREEEKAEHATTVEEAEEGEKAIDQAIDILSHFYGAAAKATVELQQPSVEDEAPDAGFSGAYTGSQGASTGILGMMDVIKSDFARTIKETLAAEEQAKRDFVEYERTTLMSIKTKETALEATSHELTECLDKLATDGDELRTQQELFDGAVKTWEELVPQCIADPGMSYEERVARRNAEVQALKDAYCILDDREAGCSGVFLQTDAFLAKK